MQVDDLIIRTVLSPMNVHLGGSPTDDAPAIAQVHTSRMSAIASAGRARPAGRTRGQGRDNSRELANRGWGDRRFRDGLSTGPPFLSRSWTGSKDVKQT